MPTGSAVPAWVPLSGGGSHLYFGAAVLEVEEALLALAAPRVEVTRFRKFAGGAGGQAPARFRLRLERSPSGAEAVGLGDGPGRYEVVGDTVRADADPWEPRSAEAALKALFAVAALRQGALLVHGSAVAFEGGAAVALGASGAGKSTFARLLVEAGGALLSDESVALAPSGEVWATPFHSDFDAPQELAGAPLRALLTLSKSPAQALVSLSQAGTVEAILAHAYRPPPSELSCAELLQRSARIGASAKERIAYAFRIHPETGDTWSARLS